MSMVWPQYYCINVRVLIFICIRMITYNLFCYNDTYNLFCYINILGVQSIAHIEITGMQSIWLILQRCSLLYWYHRDPVYCIDIIGVEYWIDVTLIQCMASILQDISLLYRYYMDPVSNLTLILQWSSLFHWYYRSPVYCLDITESSLLYGYCRISVYCTDITWILCLI